MNLWMKIDKNHVINTAIRQWNGDENEIQKQGKYEVKQMERNNEFNIFYNTKAVVKLINDAINNLVIEYLG